MIRWLLCLIAAYLTAMSMSQTAMYAMPRSQEVPKPAQEQEADAAAKPAQSTRVTRSGRNGTDAKPTPSTLVNINTATAQELDSLPGIGMHMAQRIVDYRQKNGPFKRLEDLMGVQGIGEKNFLKLKPLITITPPKGEHTGTAQR